MPRVASPAMRSAFVVHGGAAALVVLTLASLADAASRSIDLGNGVSIELVEIPAGKFTQGSAAGTPGHGDDEATREVTISKPFLIARTPVTIVQWEHFAFETAYKTEAEKGTSGGFGWNGKDLVQDKKYTWKETGSPRSADTPVTIITYADAQAFDAWLSKRAGFEVRLPTEAEYEYAARGNAKTRFFWGDDGQSAELHAWFAKNANGGPQPVGKKPANAFGLFDMQGNVWEWCSDWYGPITPPPVTDPRVDSPAIWEKSDKPRRVLKGGSWRTDDRDKMRVATRYRATEGSRNADFGFRVVGIPGNPPVAQPPGPSSSPDAGPPGAPDGTGKNDPGKSDSRPSTNDEGCAALGIFGLLAVIVAGTIGLIIRALMKRMTPTPANPQAFAGWQAGPQKLAPGSPYRARVGPDGFWIDAPPNVKEGDQIGYVAKVGQRTVRGRAVITRMNQGTYVYTGTPPSDVSFADYVAVGQGMHASTQRYDQDTSTSSFADNSSGWPSAY